MANPFKHLDIGGWLYSLLVSVIGGGSQAVVGAITAGIIDPDHFKAGTHDFYALVMGMFAMNAIVNLFMFLKQSPLPKVIEDPK